MKSDLSPSKFAAQCLGLAPVPGAPSKDGFVCAKCGAEYPAGDAMIPFRPGNTFCDEHELANRESGHECGYCAAFAGKAEMMRMQDTFVSRELVCSIKRGAWRRWVLEHLHEIEPPYLFLMSDTQLAHLVWRTPLSWDPRCVQIRIASRQLMADVPKCLDLCGRLPEGVKPLMYADREVRALISGEPSKGVRELGLDGEFATLSPGDWWVLAALSYSTEPPTRPDPLEL